MCTPTIMSSFAPKIRIISNKTSVTFLLSVYTRQTDGQLSVHTNTITVHRNPENSLADINHVKLVESVK